MAKGYTQKEVIDFKEVFSPTIRHGFIRVILAITIVQGMKLNQPDLKIVFLSGKLEEEILLFQHEGYVFLKKEDHVYMLKKSLYRFK